MGGSMYAKGELPFANHFHYHLGAVEELNMPNL